MNNTLEVGLFTNVILINLTDRGCKKVRLSRFRIGFCKTKLDSKPFGLLLHLWEMTEK